MTMMMNIVDCIQITQKYCRRGYVNGSITATYASETWKSTARIRQQLDVFHHRNLRKILGIT